jgi:NADH dehydrogenase
MKRAVIVGAGFGGLETAKRLGGKPIQVTIIDRKNHHTFQPLLYQVATAGLSPGEIAAPVRRIFRQRRNVEVLLGDVTGFDLERRHVFARDFEVDYDYLVVAAGATHSYFGHPEWQQLAPGLKTIEDALEIRRRVLLTFELAEREAVVRGLHKRLNLVVIGGGPTGVELAGTLAEVARRTLRRDFRRIDPVDTNIILLEGAPRVLPAYPADLSRSAEAQLRRLGVEVHTGTMVTAVEPGGIHIGDTWLPAAVTLWAAGVAASPLGRLLGVPTDKAGRVLVTPDLSVPGHPEVFVVGDLAALEDARGKPVPGLAPAAIQQGRCAAGNILSHLSGEPPKAFAYHDKGMLATIGRAAAVADFGPVHLSGLVAWLAWLFVHILFLVGFRNRIAVLFDWALSYLTFERAIRLITGTAIMPGEEYELPSFGSAAQRLIHAVPPQEPPERAAVPRKTA